MPANLAVANICFVIRSDDVEIQKLVLPIHRTTDFTSRRANHDAPFNRSTLRQYFLNADQTFAIHGESSFAFSEFEICACDPIRRLEPPIARWNPPKQDFSVINSFTGHITPRRWSFRYATASNCPEPGDVT